MAGPPLHDRLYRALLKLFPREFRGDFGDQMAEDFRDQRADAAASGRAAGVRLWARTSVDILRRAPGEHLDILRRDAGYALRLFRRRPGMMLSALLTLAIGIGLTAAVFSVAYGVLWQKLPLPDSERLVHLSEISPAPRLAETRVSVDNFIDWQRETRTLDALAALIPFTSATFVHDDGAEQIPSPRVSREFFKLVSARPLLGRLFDDADFGSAGPDVAEPTGRVAVISHDLWQRRFGGRSDIIGHTADFSEDGLVEIVGVLEPGFQFPLARDAAAWLPLVEESPGRRARYITVLGRLAPHATADAAQAEFQVIADSLASAHPASNGGWGVGVTPLREHLTAGVGTQLWFLFGTAICVLLIACASVSNLLLSHIVGRRRELATRAALGASRAHLVRQALTEGLVLSLAGGLAGFMLAWWSVPALIAFAPREIPRLNEITVGWPVLAFALGASLCVGLTCGLAAAWNAGRAAPGLTLRSHRAAGASHRGRHRQALVVGQVAVALMLAVAAGLLVQTLRAVTDLPLGYDPSNVISIGFSPGIRAARDTAASIALEARLIERIRSLDGVVAAGVGSRPLGAAFGSSIALASAPSESIRISVDAVSPGYLEALGARLAAGRFFDDRDGPGAEAVALVNEAAAMEHWPNGALGQRVLHNNQSLLLVGVLGDVRRTRLEVEPEATLYLPSAQSAMFRTNNMLVRTSGDPRALLPAIRAVAREVDPRLPLTRIETLSERLDSVLAPRRFNLWLVSLFSSIALVLAVVGIYGVLMESVAQRVPEIGVRMALGASAAGVMRMFLRQGGWMIGIGVALGTAAAFGLSGVMASFVFGVPATDPVSFAAACLAVTMAGLLACAIPARRAARVDPVIALRQE
jgi:putative ABC transport system permease protein